MNFDLKQVPFSRFGSYLAFSYIKEMENVDEGLYLKSLHGGDEHIKHDIKIELMADGKSVPFECIANPALLRLKSYHGIVEICFQDFNIVRIKGTGVGIRLKVKCKSYDYSFVIDDKHCEINKASSEIRYMLSCINGNMFFDAPWKIRKNESITIDIDSKENSFFELAIEEYEACWIKKKYIQSFEECVNSVELEYLSWLNKTLEVDNRYSEARELASYITWSCVVKKRGKLTRQAMYMSKNWMTNIWSWDNCFNAMALVKNNPQLAWDQIMIFIDNQHDTGAFPDFINDKFALWNFCKPPIQGWILKWMMERTDFIDKDLIKEIYHPLVRWTEWWLNYRDYDNDGIAQYNHGNDSGWDNSTIFEKGIPVESPDLSAFLVLQMEVLAEFALLLNRIDEHKMWEQKANSLLNKLIEHFWDGKAFKAFISGNHECIESDSLLMLVPLILGKRLPDYIMKSLVERLKDKNSFLTEFGLATESISSDKYECDGYWRGPIWAPSTMIFVDGLRRAGEKQLASEISRRFCDMVYENGMAENFDALTGKGLRDRAFTWTSSVFLVLANEYC